MQDDVIIFVDEKRNCPANDRSIGLPCITVGIPGFHASRLRRVQLLVGSGTFLYNIIETVTTFEIQRMVGIRGIRQPNCRGRVSNYNISGFLS